MNSWTTALLCINLPQRSFCRGLCVPAEIQGREVWWHPQVEAAPPELGRLSPQDHKSQRRRVSHCCWGNAAPDESNSTYHFVPHLSTPTHWRSHTPKCDVVMHLRVINTAWIKGMHRIVFGIHLFSSPCLLILTFAFSPRGSVPPMMTLLQGAKVDFSHHYHLCALVCLHVQKIHPCPFLFFPSLYAYYPLHHKLFRPPGAHPSPYHPKH